jgi:hypothetical protein
MSWEREGVPRIRELGIEELGIRELGIRDPSAATGRPSGGFQKHEPQA